MVGIGRLFDGLLEPITDWLEVGGLRPFPHSISEGGPTIYLTRLKGDVESPRAGDLTGKLKVLEVDPRSHNLVRVDVIEDGLEELWFVRGLGRGRLGVPVHASDCAGGRAGPSRPIVAATAQRVAFGCLPVALAAAGARGDTTAARSAAARSPGDNGSLGRRV